MKLEKSIMICININLKWRGLNNMGFFNKKELTKISELENEIITYKKQLEELGALEYSEIQKNINSANEQLEK